LCSIQALVARTVGRPAALLGTVSWMWRSAHNYRAGGGGAEPKSRRSDWLERDLSYLIVPSGFSPSLSSLRVLGIWAPHTAALIAPLLALGYLLHLGGPAFAPDFREAWEIQRVVDGIVRSAKERRWLDIEEV